MTKLPINITVSAIPTGAEIYNAIMVQIEPELTLSIVPTLDAKYAEETAEQKSQRLERYKKAMDIYDMYYDKYMNSIRDAADACQRDARDIAQEQSKFEDAEKQNVLLSTIDSL